MLLTLTDFFALLSINTVMCAACLHVCCCRRWMTGRWCQIALVVFFFLLWLPVGPAHLPVVAYIRGISSDLSITLVALACLSLRRWLGDLPAMRVRESLALYLAIALAATLLYPTALGWGDHDIYRLGWGTLSLWLILLVLCLTYWWFGLRLLPVLIAAALLAWVLGLLESTNLWDYLIDPWLALMAFWRCLRMGIATWRRWQVSFSSYNFLNGHR